MLRDHLQQLVRDAVGRLTASGAMPDGLRDVPVEIADSARPEHGDYACNLAMVAAKRIGKNPRQIGEALAAELSTNSETFESVEVAGPGFVNLRLRPGAISRYLPELTDGPSLRKTDPPERLNVEYVSVNPNGPITIGSARGAAFGDTLTRVLRAVGKSVDREYYVNDGVNSQQMKLFAESVRALALGRPLPEKGYRGEYVADIARRLLAESSPESVAAMATEDVQHAVESWMIDRQRADLDQFHVEFERWFSEQSLHDSGHVQASARTMEDIGNAYWATEPRDAEEVAAMLALRGLAPTDAPTGPDEDEDEAPARSSNPALWIASHTNGFGDDKDRVLIRSDGRPAYIAADVAYLDNKLRERNYDRALLVLGPDHHGYIGRLYAMYKALGFPVDEKGRPARFEIIIYQVVRFLKDGKPAPMRKRDGNIYELRDLIDELGKAQAPDASPDEQRRIGADVARFFFLMRSHDTHLDFDIDLATKQSDENPVFYVQYAHARISSVLRKAPAGTMEPPDACAGETASLLTHPRELSLLKKIMDLPEEVGRCAADYGVNRLTTYSVELARTYHHFYDACRILQPDQPELSHARLALCRAARATLHTSLDLLGVSAPEQM